ARVAVGEIFRITHFEARRESLRRSARGRLRDQVRRDVDAGRERAGASRREREVARAAGDIEHALALCELKTRDELGRTGRVSDRDAAEVARGPGRTYALARGISRDDRRSERLHESGW